MDLPEITSEPRHHPDCCLSLSTKLLDVLSDVFGSADVAANNNNNNNNNNLILSIGSGSGLLEALLLSRWSSPSPDPSSAGTTATTATNLQIEGVEAAPSANKYLPGPEPEPGGCFSTVRGSWDAVAPRDRPRARALLFAYPRSAALVERYVRAFFSAGGGGGDNDGAGSGNVGVAAAAAVVVVVWLGHRSDWPDFERCFAVAAGSVPGTTDIGGGEGKGEGVGVVEVVEGARAGLVEYEMLAVLRRRGAKGMSV